MINDSNYHLIHMHPNLLQGLVVRSIVSLTKSLVKNSLNLTVLTKWIAVIIFLAEKLSGAFALFAVQKLLTFFSKKWQCFLRIIL